MCHESNAKMHACLNSSNVKKREWIQMCLNTFLAGVFPEGIKVLKSQLTL